MLAIVNEVGMQRELDRDELDGDQSTDTWGRGIQTRWEEHKNKAMEKETKKNDKNCSAEASDRVRQCQGQP
jgi:hypothetical protein